MSSVLTPHPSTLTPQPSLRIGIFGGSFNPVHLGHTALAAYICEQGLVDEVWMMVSPQNPLKQDLMLLDEQHRLAMLRLAVEPYPMLQACDFEFHLPRPSYTYHTLQALRAAYPKHAFSLIIGEDNWDCFDRWFRGGDILRETPIIIYPRDSVESLELRVEGAALPSRFVPASACKSNNEVVNPQPSTLLPQRSPLQLFPFSSTDVRNNLASDQCVDHMLHPAVVEYIHRNRLYQ